MPTPLTQFNICSNALTMLGSDPIVDFEATPNSVKCGLMYPMIRNRMLASYPWKFSIHSMQISRLVATPATRYAHYFDIPDDAMVEGVMALYSSPGDGAMPIKDFVVQDGKILSNETELYADYQHDTNEAFFTPMFADMLARCLAVDLCMVVTSDRGLRDSLKVDAYGTSSQNLVGGFIGAARNNDARNAPNNNRMSNFPLVAVRTNA